LEYRSFLGRGWEVREEGMVVRRWWEWIWKGGWVEGGEWGDG